MCERGGSLLNEKNALCMTLYSQVVSSYHNNPVMTKAGSFSSIAVDVRDNIMYVCVRERERDSPSWNVCFNVNMTPYTLRIHLKLCVLISLDS